MDEHFIPAVEPPGTDGDGEQARAAWWFAFRGSELLVWLDASSARIPTVGEVVGMQLTVRRQLYLGHLDGLGTWSAELSDEVDPPPGMRFLGLRSLYGQVDELLYTLAGRAAQIVAWDRDHQFCGRCGTPTVPTNGVRARRCPACGLLAFPRLSPAIIVLIEREGRVLLARGSGMPPSRYGIVAGFVEPGESLEEAVRREVREEVGLEITNLTYFGSQAWPFPHAVMIGFTASHAAGEIELRDGELAEAGWFGIDSLPLVPAKLSIARRLLDAWAARIGRTIEQP